jgi:hypothetical protein
MACVRLLYIHNFSHTNLTIARQLTLYKKCNANLSTIIISIAARSLAKGNANIRKATLPSSKPGPYPQSNQFISKVSPLRSQSILGILSNWPRRYSNQSHCHFCSQAAITFILRIICCRCVRLKQFRGSK